MKKTAFFIFLLLLIFGSSVQGQKTALLLIDIQDFYFPGGKSALAEPEKAAGNAAILLASFRNSNRLVIHVRHNSEPGGSINVAVKPLPEEKVFTKNDVNAFKGTGLYDFLKSNLVDTLVICGMQTHMCVEAATRAASDFGFKCILIHDACATKDLKFGDIVIKAAEVHYSTLATLRNYAVVESTNDYLKNR